MATSAAQDREGEETLLIRLKTSLPQVVAAFSASSYHIVLGVSLSYSAILIPQLFAEQKAGTSDIPIDTEIASWLASILTLVTILSALVAALLIDKLGRLNLIRVSILPTLIGWIVIAIAPNLTTLLIGRVLTGYALPWAATAAGAYNAEISSPKLRGALLSLSSLCISCGILLAYVGGMLMNWRLVAWCCIIFCVLPFVMVMFIPESFSYLLMKGKDEKALASFKWFNKHKSPEVIAQQFSVQQQTANAKKQAQSEIAGNELVRGLKMFGRPSCYKPLFIIAGLFFFQHFSGIFMTLFYAVTFLQAVGTEMDPFLASVLLGSARVIMSFVTIPLFRRLPRRTMLFTSTLGMCFSTFVSGTFTLLIFEGLTTQSWVPVAMIVLYMVFSMLGLLALPFISSAELFPIEVRGSAQGVSLSICYVIMFISLKIYFVLKDILGGVVGLQYYFSAMSFVAFIYGYIFLPESQGKTLTEIEEYFRNNTMYVKLSCKKKNVINET